MKHIASILILSSCLPALACDSPTAAPLCVEPGIVGTWLLVRAEGGGSDVPAAASAPAIRWRFKPDSTFIISHDGTGVDTSWYRFSKELHYSPGEDSIWVLRTGHYGSAWTEFRVRDTLVVWVLALHQPARWFVRE
jgi:hypothetical protein